jgi:hypothetical protein
MIDFKIYLYVNIEHYHSYALHSQFILIIKL